MGLGQGDRGYAMAALLVGMTVMAVLMSAAMPVWSHFAQREKEEELIWRGQQYARAIGLFQRKYANTFPPTVEVLVEQKFLRKKYKDPVTGEDFQPIPATGMPGGGVVAPPGMPAVPGGMQNAPGQPRNPPIAQQRTPPRMTSVGTTVQGGIGIQGVVSKSDKASIKIYNGRTKYNEWAFVYLASAQAPGAPQPGAFPRQPGMPNQPGLFGQPGGPPQPGSPGPPGTTFRPLGGNDRRPPPPAGMTPAGPPRQPSPFGTPRPPGD